MLSTFFFFNDTATTEIYTLSLHDALPIYPWLLDQMAKDFQAHNFSLHHLFKTIMKSSAYQLSTQYPAEWKERSEEHTSELQSRPHLVCRLLLEKKKKPDKVME